MPARIYRHKKRGSTYEWKGTAKLQTGYPITEGTTLVSYEAGDGTLWARPYREFYDGRFEAVE